MKLSAIALSLGMASLLAACAAGNAPRASSEQAPAQPKNVILFIGDGMGVSTVTAARIYDGQTRGETGEENLLSFEEFPALALVKTYNTNQQVPDSAGTASAMNTGRKTRAGVIDVAAQSHRGDCGEGLAATMPNAAEQLHAKGKAIGIVSTARITHATPAAVYAHAPERDWESDGEMPEPARATGCTDIAKQLTGFPFEVALGGGSRYFFGRDMGGERRDAAADLPSAWASATGGHFVSTAAAMKSVPADGKPLFGLFSKSHMAYMLERKPGTSEPTLSEMTATAIDRLQSTGKGYYLMVEGGRIDHGHHDGRADLALSETQEFARAVKVALGKVDLSDTLILVTADHSHVFTMAGYPTRGNPILGLARGNDDRGEPTGEPILATDGLPYTTLGYQNGPGAHPGQPRSAPSDDPHAVKQALVPTGDVFNGVHDLSETHGGEDVALYATGAGSSAVHGVIEQNRIFDYLMSISGE